jgi:PAS domain S-box-containing protein
MMVTEAQIRVLLLEDEPGDAQLVKVHLYEVDGYNFDITSSATLKEARKQLESHRFDVILMDLNLPDSSCLGTVKAMLSASQGLPIIVMTGHDDIEFAVSVLQAGAADYLVKGDYGRDGLFRAIRYALYRTTMESHARLLVAALNACADGMVITNRDAQIEWCNEAFCRLTGYSLEEAKGYRPGELMKSGYQNNEFYQAMWQTILSGQVWMGELINRRKNGELYHEELTIAPVRDEQGHIHHFIGRNQDITQR